VLESILFDNIFLKDSVICPIEIEGKTTEIEIWDLRGGEDYARIRVAGYQNIECFIITFDIGNQKSFHRLKDQLIPEIKEHMPSTPFILVGLKRDLREETQPEEERPLVSFQEADKSAIEVEAFKYLECSALKHPQEVEEVFQMAATLAHQKRSGTWNKPH
jgi:small GTP-binding protein